MFRNLLLCALLLPAAGFAQVTWFPDALNVSPFYAGFLEPRIGFNVQSGKNTLRLDIGSSRDLLWSRLDNGAVLSAGADFFTYTRLRGEDDFHFPVHAVDYLFGCNTAYKISTPGGSRGFRARLSHISAHLVDGQYDGVQQLWKNGRNPIVYSREFIEITPFYEQGGMRGYATYTWLFHVVPRGIGKHMLQAGGEYFHTVSNGPLVSVFAAYEARLLKVNAWSVNNSLTLGVKFGKPFGAGFTLLANLYSGYSLHGEYYDLKEEYAAFGFNVDL